MGSEILEGERAAGLRKRRADPLSEGATVKLLGATGADRPQRLGQGRLFEAVARSGSLPVRSQKGAR